MHFAYIVKLYLYNLHPSWDIISTAYIHLFLFTYVVGPQLELVP